MRSLWTLAMESKWDAFMKSVTLNFDKNISIFVVYLTSSLRLHMKASLNNTIKHNFVENC